MQNIGLSHSSAANNSDISKENEQLQVSVWTDQLYLYSCLRAVSTRLQRFALFLHHGDHRRRGTNTPVEVWPPFCAPCAFPFHVIVVWPWRSRGWALTSSINNLCRHRRAGDAIHTAITILPWGQRDPGALFIKLPDPSRLQEHFVPALAQPDNKDGVHTHHPAANTCYRSVWEHKRTPEQVV